MHKSKRDSTIRDYRMGLEPRQIKMGRPTIFTKIILHKLELAFSMDCTDEEACVLANIAPSSLYNYQKTNPEFLERKRLLRNIPILKARHAIVSGLGVPTFAFKYMERKRPKEFGPGAQGENFEPEQLTQEQKDRLDRIIAGLTSKHESISPL